MTCDTMLSKLQLLNPRLAHNHQVATRDVILRALWPDSKNTLMIQFPLEHDNVNTL